ncbi:DUF3313 domain-containing protein [Shewanella gelidimarina]|uniref:DUF3313 domain-containing protein n=1 Tax=Shewanella gelidimarina TaxID=56813 RepID=UPI0020109C1C|nr:DUF3313 domain-containing protein [Shewanella gelidimarina]MCL1057318.1 DUF3313 domain-containing protein [Shewanella gelidimarina]
MNIARLIVLGCMLLLVGCGTVQDYRKSQMFSTFEDFKPGPEGGIDLVWARPDIKSLAGFHQVLNQYDNVIVDQAWLLLDDKERYDGLDDQEIVEVSKYLIDQIKQKASKRYTVVEKTTDKTLRVSVALTNIETPNPILAITSSIMPVGLGISTISKIVTGEHTNVGSATIELMISDAQTGKPIVAMIDRKAGSKDLSTMIDSTDDAKDAVDWWIEQLGEALRGETL